MSQTRRALSEIGLKPSKKLGQNYVVDQSLIDCMVDAADIGRGDTVLEIGAGIGTLTKAIASRAGRVIAVEKEEAAAEFLEAALPGNAEVLLGDALEMRLPPTDKVLSNLPYSISTPLTFKLLSEGTFKLAVLTYQKEVAERMVAKPGGADYSRLSVACQLRADVEIVRAFPKDSFFPVPKVESAVVKISPKEDVMSASQWAWLDDTLKAMFSQRKRVLRKALETYGKIKRMDTPHIADAIGQEVMRKRVFELSPKEFKVIAEELSSKQGNRLGGDR